MTLSNPLLGVLVMGLACAVIIDITTKRIPNLLIVAMLLSALALHFWINGWSGLTSSLLGLITGLFCFLPLYVFGAMGAGDVKLLGATGALLGPEMVVVVALISIVCGGFIALIYIAIGGGLPSLLRRYSQMASSLFSNHFTYIPPAAGEMAGRRFPYALAIAAGTSLAMVGF